MKKTVFIGSVLSSKVALQFLIKKGINIDLVCSLDEEASKNISDYYPIHNVAEENSLPYIKFKKINNHEVIKTIEKINPDFTFVIGISQIIPDDILININEYAIGFHPTPLPKYRGRAALPWQIILGIHESKISLFKLDKGMDSGDIICQYPYIIEENDYAIDVYNKVCKAMEYALNKCLVKIYNNSVDFKKQREEDATYLLTRRPEDGKINWDYPGIEIHALIRAASYPYPGAFTFYNNKKITVSRARIEENHKYIGLPGQIACLGNGQEISVVTKDSLLVFTDYITEDGNTVFDLGKKFE